MKYYDFKKDSSDPAGFESRDHFTSFVQRYSGCHGLPGINFISCEKLPKHLIEAVSSLECAASLASNVSITESFDSTAVQACTAQIFILTPVTLYCCDKPKKEKKKLGRKRKRDKGHGGGGRGAGRKTV